MKCNACGAIGITGTSCPDCGGDDLVVEAGPATTTTIQATPATTPDPPLMPAMPSMDVTVDVKGPVVNTIVMPDKRRVDLHDNEEFLVAHESTDVTGVHCTASDETVSSTPVRIFAENGKLYATGGGRGGFAIWYKPEQKVEIVRGTANAVGAGKDTRVSIK